MCLDILNSLSLRCFHSLNGIILHATTLQWLTEPDPPVDIGNVGDVISVYILLMEMMMEQRKGSGSFEAGT